MSFITIYITHATEKAALELSQVLIREKLVACANIFPIQSSYWWSEAIQNENEWVSLVKTRSELWEMAEARISGLHPYKTPCIMRQEVQANAAYESWIQASTIDPKTQ